MGVCGPCIAQAFAFCRRFWPLPQPSPRRGGGKTSKQLLHSRAQGRQQLGFKPRVVLEPAVVAWAGVGQHQGVWPPALPLPHRLGYAQFFCLWQVPGERVDAYHYRELDVRQLRHHAFAPQRRAFGARRRVARALRRTAGVAKAHGHDGHFFAVIKDILAHAQPLAQAPTAGVVERHTALVHLDARCLAGQQNVRAVPGLQHRARAQRQEGCADGAGADLAQECVKRTGGGHAAIVSLATTAGRYHRVHHYSLQQQS